MELEELIDIVSEELQEEARKRWNIPKIIDEMTVVDIVIKYLDDGNIKTNWPPKKYYHDDWSNYD